MKALAILTAVLLVGLIIFSATNAKGKELLEGTITRPRNQAVGGTLLIDLIGIILVGGLSLVGLLIAVIGGLIFFPIILLAGILIFGVIFGVPLLIVVGISAVCALLLVGPFILVGGLLLMGIIGLFLAAVGALIVGAIGIVGLIILAGLFIGGILLVGAVGLPLLSGLVVVGVCLAGAGLCIKVDVNLLRSAIDTICDPLNHFKNLVRRALE